MIFSLLCSCSNEFTLTIPLPNKSPIATISSLKFLLVQISHNTLPHTHTHTLRPDFCHYVARFLSFPFSITLAPFPLYIFICHSKYLSISQVELFNCFFVFLYPSKFYPWRRVAHLLSAKLLLKLHCQTESHLLQRKHDAILRGDKAAAAI